MAYADRFGWPEGHSVERLRRAIQQSGWTNAQVAANIGNTPNTVRSWLRGKSQPAKRYWPGIVGTVAALERGDPPPFPTVQVSGGSRRHLVTLSPTEREELRQARKTLRMTARQIGTMIGTDEHLVPRAIRGDRMHYSTYEKLQLILAMVRQAARHST